MNKFLLTTAVLAAAISVASAGIRCTFGNPVCTAGCVLLGQTSGVCDDEGTCHCSEKSISLNNLKAILPSRCHLGVSFCEGTCNAIGRKTGICTEKDGVKDCECDTSFLSPSEFALCAAESTCRIHCQANGSATGKCDGWKCRCISSDEDDIDPTASVEFED
eukprot:TRINITY_DN1011_c0_g1_i5.p1 TRINITY_DN1011_c0_g1~~TRINITY_DN1011_c0_g1_i5.p1  ORF type:complete len:162 (+),score=35.87 TRINITY_DN1011_c0_g1_i5:51-536(+)